MGLVYVVVYGHVPRHSRQRSGRQLPAGMVPADTGIRMEADTNLAAGGHEN